MCLPVLTHRLILRPESRLRKITPASVINDILGEVAVPMTAKYDDDARDMFKD